MSKSGILLATLVGLAGCYAKTYSNTPKAASTDPGTGLEVALRGAAGLRGDGILSVPIKITNTTKDRHYQAILNRCELEATDGKRFKRRPTPTSSVTIRPGRTEAATFLFGDPKTGLLTGDTFRLYVWAEATDGSGVLENLPPLVLGEGTFSSPPQGFKKSAVPREVLPPPTEAPPPTVNVPKDSPPCNSCGEPRPPGMKTCPHCGLP